MIAKQLVSTIRLFESLFVIDLSPYLSVTTETEELRIAFLKQLIFLQEFILICLWTRVEFNVESLRKEQGSVFRQIKRIIYMHFYQDWTIDLK